MSQKLPRVTSTKVTKALEKLGFSLSRQSGSHKIYKNAQGKRITVPSHKGKVLHPKVLKSILKDTDVSLEEFLKLL
ncbi:MAG: addiction module toxin, HicA family [Chloroflexi bacterium]|nr:addiction module toxin, HicA family [Chloroflexota bacterium]